jgi:hypothetical protein
MKGAQNTGLNKPLRIEFRRKTPLMIRLFNLMLISNKINLMREENKVSSRSKEAKRKFFKALFILR